MASANRRTRPLMAIFALSAALVGAEVRAEAWQDFMQGRSAQAGANLHKELSRPGVNLARQGALLQGALAAGNGMSDESKSIGVRFFAVHAGVTLGERRIEGASVAIYGNDDELDLERTDFPKVEHTAIADGRYYTYTGDPAITNLTVYGTSRGRLRYGIAPIARDGEFLEVCRFWAGEAAPAYEISRSSRIVLERLMLAPGGHFECLDEAALGDYWEIRYKSLLSLRGDELR